MIDLDNLLIYVVLPLLIGVAASIIAHFIIRFWEREHPVQQRRMIILAVAVVVILLAAFIIPSVSPQLSITIPHDNDQVSLQDTGTGGYIFTINGTSRNINRENQDILVWVEPVQPSSPEGWYLQCPPYGIVNREGDGSWVGKGVIGSTAYPAKNGDTFNIMVTVVDRTTAAAIQIHCPFTRLYPLGTSKTIVNNLVAKTE